VKGKKKMAIITCCLDDWGGSEELWSESIPFWLSAGVDSIEIFKNRINPEHPGFKKLKQPSIKFNELDPQYSAIKKIAIKFTDTIDHIYDKLGLITYQWNKQVERLYNLLKAAKPDIAIISQGINFDGLAFANQCLKLNIPYFIVSHKAVDFFWPGANDRVYMKETLLKAQKCLFVSQHNRKLTEEQFGTRLPNSDIILNPVKTRVKPLPYPSTANGYKLACIGRLFIIDKGQDILLRVLAQPKWQERDIHISFFGAGRDKDGLQELADLLEVKNISFVGYNTDLEDIWTNHHALILPSRSEGLPLTIIEAMSLGRTVITTNAGGNTEILQDNLTGFIGEANEIDFEQTLERAWAKRDEWEQMGMKAAKYIKEIMPETPEKFFINIITDYLK
jgi:glycosyltransferase involved in cell wall biosynthesis